VIGGDIDMHLEAEAPVDAVHRAQLDAFVLHLRAGAAPVIVARVGSPGAGADHYRCAALQRCRRNREQREPQPDGHCFAPNSWKSIASHRQWSSTRCTSWMRAV